MIDCDLYSSAKTVLAFCAPLIRDEAVILSTSGTRRRWEPTMRGSGAPSMSFLLRTPRCLRYL